VVADPATFVVKRAGAAEVTKSCSDEEARRMNRRSDDQLSLAIGAAGQNVRLASLLTGWAIDILTEAEESERRQEEFKSRSALFVEALDVDDVIPGCCDRSFAKVEERGAGAGSTSSPVCEGFDETVADVKSAPKTGSKRRTRKLTSATTSSA